MSAIENVIQHFEENYTLGSFEVPEWKLTIYFEPFTTKQVARFTKMRDKQGHIEALVYLITEKALDENKKKIFSPEDRMILLNKASYPVLEKVGVKILECLQGKDSNTDEELVEELKKD